MPQIYHSHKKLKISNLGNENLLPKYSITIPSFDVRLAPEIPQAIHVGVVTKGHFKMLPYLVQDQYDRVQKEGELPVIVMENSKLKATFYPQYGGRMASLYDKTTQKELLFDNPVFQPANLALRNAWFSGGIEWNGPIYGHTPLTCAPVYFAKVKCNDTEILRIYEYDRILNTTWQVDLLLPDDSPYLWYHVTARNLNDYDINYYWWTNIAAPVDDHIRFMVSSEYVVNHFFEDILMKDWPTENNKDISYPVNHQTALSLFYPDTREPIPWFSYADKDGYGLFHMATPNLKGKKLWYFGSSQGGITWMDTLSLPGKGKYIEIQAGLTETQIQLLPMAKQSKMSWTACIGPVTCDTQKVHQPDYQKALVHNLESLKSTGNFEQVSRMHEKMTKWEDITPEVVIYEGQAWGSLQERLSNKKIPGLLFTAPISQQEQPWFELLTEGTFSKQSLQQEPTSWNISTTWQEKIKKSLHEGNETWLHYLHLAATLMEERKPEEAKKYFEKSNQLKPNFQALRGIALIENLSKNEDKAIEYYFNAWQHSNQNADLFIEFAKLLIVNYRITDLQKLTIGCPDSIREHEFLSLANAQIALHDKQFSLARKHLVREYTFIREGEDITTDIWFASFYQEKEEQLKRPLTPQEKQEIQLKNQPPSCIDFRMKEP